MSWLSAARMRLVSLSHFLIKVSFSLKRSFALLESRKIEQGGGYVFANQTIPTTFNFGGNFSQISQ